MIHTLLIEPYTLPITVPVEVTILRGVRRLRFSSSLRRRYNDFSPKIWHLLTKLGYKKYLQRIYVTIEHNCALLSSFYQFPILLGILEALQLIPEQFDLLTLGKLDVYNKVYAPFDLIDLPNTGSFMAYFPNELQFQQEINGLLTNSHAASTAVSRPLSSALQCMIVPQAIFTYGGIDIARTSVSCLKKITRDLIPFLTFSQQPMKSPMANQRINAIEELLRNGAGEITVINNKKETATIAVSSFLKQFVKT